MPKQIKKILFRQISTFLGLAVIVSFSSIFGAILVREVLAVPVGTGSVITAVNNLATALTDIKGDSFVKNTHSLKQIKDQVNTIETKIGVNSDVPAMNTSLFAGQQSIRDKLDTVGGGGPGSWNCQVVSVPLNWQSTSVICPNGFQLITGGCNGNAIPNASYPILNGWMCVPSGQSGATAWCCQ